MLAPAVFLPKPRLDHAGPVTLWHQSERLLDVDAVVESGRWGRTVLAAGQDHRFFFREQLLELWRVSQTHVAVSRFACTFAFDDLRVAKNWSATDSTYCYEVEPVDPGAPIERLDMLWLTWMGEPASSFDRTISQCRSYWEGRTTGDVAAHAKPQWEVLLGCALRITRRVV